MQTLHATVRKEFGRAVRSIRAQGKIPAILYGRGIPSTPLEILRKEFLHAYRAAGASTLVDVIFGEQASKVLLTAVQRDPLSGDIIHADLRAVRMDEKLRTRIPLTFVGEAPAVKELGGTLVKNMDELEVECLPGDLVHEIPIDISTLKAFGNTVRIRDVALPPGIVPTQNPDAVVATAEAALTEEEMKRELEAATTVDVSQIEVAGKKEKEEEAAAAGSEEQKEEGKTADR